MVRAVQNAKDFESAVKEVARQREGASDPRWEALAAGELRSEEQGALRDLDPDLYEAFRPSSEREQALMAERVLDGAGVPPERLLERAVVPPKRSLSRRFAFAGVLTATVGAMAAAVALWMIPPRSGTNLPRYELSVNGEVHAMGGPAIPVQRTRGAPTEITLRPETRVTGPVGFVGFLVKDGEVRPWNPKANVRETGTLQIAGPIDEIFAGVQAGTWGLWVVVGRPEVLNAQSATIRDAAQVIAREPTALPPICQQGECSVLRTSIRLEAAPEIPQ